MFDLTAPPSAHAVATAPDRDPIGLTAATMAAALDELGQGLLIVDVPIGRLLHANRLALAECARHGLLSLEDGVVQAPAPADQRLLQQALQASLRSRRGLVPLRGGLPDRARPARDDDGGVDPAPRTRAHRPVALILAVVPLPTGREPSQAMIVFGRRQVADPLGVGYFARLYGLTPAEESVLIGLCRGQKPAEIASAHGVAISTIRTHVNALRLKTGADSIRAITQQVATLPPLAPALHEDPPGPDGSRQPAPRRGGPAP